VDGCDYERIRTDTADMCGGVWGCVGMCGDVWGCVGCVGMCGDVWGCVGM
jgi:hypothetical protein